MKINEDQTPKNHKRSVGTYLCPNYRKKVAVPNFLLEKFTLIIGMKNQQWPQAEALI